MQKAQRLGLMLALLMSFMVLSGTAMAQQQRAGVGQLALGLLNVQVGNVQVNDVIDVDVRNVLNNNQIRVLNNAINNNTILSQNQIDLTNLLRDANILSNNEVVVGVLSGGIVVFQQ